MASTSNILAMSCGIISPASSTFVPASIFTSIPSWPATAPEAVPFCVRASTYTMGHIAKPFKDARAIAGVCEPWARELHAPTATIPSLQIVAQETPV